MIFSITDVDFAKKLENLLKTYKYEDKPKITATPASKTKRKLFTPNFGDEAEEIPEEDTSKILFSNNDNDNLNVRLIGKMPLVNKQLDSVKSNLPIFKLPTPGKTPNNIKSKIA